ncbi:hypothetical protein [Paraburkholderia caribensis]|uniref:hypothetical protein n=1 Tax=Paraburkholderia caribensis TaxID=75105 RepID=UPI0034D1FC96
MSCCPQSSDASGLAPSYRTKRLCSARHRRDNLQPAHTITHITEYLLKMPNFSRNWRHLASIVAAYPPFVQNTDSPSLEDHVRAKAMSFFLVRATLATPRLDRETVEDVLSGKLNWPAVAGESENQFKGVDISLPFLEECGFVSFYAGWLSVHFQTPKDRESVHPSLVPLIDALEHLKDMCAGRKGLIQPHYSCSQDKLDATFAEARSLGTVGTTLPELCLVDGSYHLPPQNRSFDSLTSTYLWRAFRAQDPTQAFERWLACMRVNCQWAMPVLFQEHDHEEREAFTKELLRWLAADKSLEQSLLRLKKQSRNEDEFASIANPTNTQIFIDVNVNGRTVPRQERVTELPKPSLDTLANVYPSSSNEDLSDLESVKRSQGFHRHDPDLFYSWLIASMVETSIRIDGMTLVSSGFVEALLELATSRPILKHLLLIVVPRYSSAKYKVFLLSQPATCAVALYYLTRHQIFRSSHDDDPPLQLLDTGFLQLVFRQFLRTVEDEADLGERLLEVFELLCEGVNLQSDNFSGTREYRTLLNYLNCLDHKQIVALAHSFSARHFDPSRTVSYSPPASQWYLLGFWLIDRLDEAGIDYDGDVGHRVRSALVARYEGEFKHNLSGQCKTLEPTAFVSALPWNKLFTSQNSAQLLALSRERHRWNLTVHTSNGSLTCTASAVAHYLQVLMSVGKFRSAGEPWDSVALRATDIARVWGFGDRKDVVYLFRGGPIVGEYDLWSAFCSFANLLPDNLYNDFIESCIGWIPLNQLFTLVERTTITARAQVLRNEISIRQSSGTEDMGLAALEQAFVSACESGHTELSEKLLTTAKKTLEERFGASTDRLVIHRRHTWLSYEYKLRLIKLSGDFRQNPDGFSNAAIALEIPHVRNGAPHPYFEGTAEWQECDYFRRYITASMYLETNPEKCVLIMRTLFHQSKDKNHAFMLFKGRIALFEKNGNLANLRSALSHFKTVAGTTEPARMSNRWVSAILGSYATLQDTSGLDSFWEKLSEDQKQSAEILYPYCKSLIARGDTLVAKQALLRYHEHNRDTAGDPDVEQLIKELVDALPAEHSTSELLKHVIEQAQRNKLQLKAHYKDIVSRGFSDYVEIVGDGESQAEYLAEIVFHVSRELVLRKKNIHIHLEKNGKSKTSITKEDLINDWFTSLFDLRMAEARVGFRDQKRTGESQSGISPGEADGFITDSKNRRLALFEAFRLSSMETQVISEHLGKIAGYDNESLSPVFIVAYCDVADFEGFIPRYVGFINEEDYAGFSTSIGPGSQLTEQKNAGHVWMGLETRHRDGQDISFYHVLLNLGSK